MKKNIALLFIAYIISGNLYAQSYFSLVKPVDSDNWKYLNLNTKTFLEKDYQVCYSYSEDGIAVVYYPKKNLYALINTKGEEIKTEIEKFDLKDILGYAAKGYSDGLLVIKVDKKLGCIDVSGRLKIPLKYDKIVEFHDGYGVGVINQEFFVLNKNGQETKINDPEIKEVKHFYENYAPFKLGNGAMGFIDVYGKTAIPAKFPGVGYFSDGLAWARNATGQVGFINYNGEWVISPKFEKVHDFDKESGLALVKLGEEWVYINKKAEILRFNIPIPFHDFSEGLAMAKKDELFGFINNKGEWIIPPQFDGVHDFTNGYACVKQNGRWGIINKEGKWIINPEFAGIKEVSRVK